MVIVSWNIIQPFKLMSLQSAGDSWEVSQTQGEESLQRTLPSRTLVFSPDQGPAGHRSKSGWGADYGWFSFPVLCMFPTSCHQDVFLWSSDVVSG